MFTIPPLTSDIIAISLDSGSSPSINLKLPNRTPGANTYGWGFAWYPDDYCSAMVTKSPSTRGEQVTVDAITDWSSFRSTVFFCKIRGSSDGYSYTEAQPFSRSFAGKDWIFTHNGDLNKPELMKFQDLQNPMLEPLGRTDSEEAFCTLLSLLQKENVRKLSDLSPSVLLSWFQRFDQLGSADMFLSDGSSIACFHGSQSPKNMYHLRIQPPHNRDTLISESAEIKFDDPRDTYRTASIVSSMPFTNGNSDQMQGGQLLIMKRGVIVWNSNPENVQIRKTIPQAQQKENIMIQAQVEQAQEHVLNTRAITETVEGTPLNYRLYEITHSTHYEYTEPVEHSTHTFRLQGTDDPTQEVVTSTLLISSPAEEIQYEDVFGNQAIHCIIDQPYTKLSVEARSKIKVFASPPDDHSLSRRQSSIPLAWMPWQRQMMMPYLLPTELPESQLTELTEYAMSFVERNDYHLLRTIEDMNKSIYRDYNYVSDSTSVYTTPFEVYTSRQGVCQDFANLFICMARLLSIPARYRMGYIYTGKSYENKIQSDASHAWAEVYLPYVGWRGFDPTNGCQATQDHIRVASGRNYRDATPTSGTIYKGGGTETLTIDVKVCEIQN